MVVRVWRGRDETCLGEGAGAVSRDLEGEAVSRYGAGDGDVVFGDGGVGGDDCVGVRAAGVAVTTKRVGESGVSLPERHGRRRARWYGRY